MGRRPPATPRRSLPSGRRSSVRLRRTFRPAPTSTFPQTEAIRLMVCPSRWTARPTSPCPATPPTRRPKRAAPRTNASADAGHPIPIIKDEELLLLQAEASWFSATPNKAQAIADLNLVRQNSGLLPPTTLTIASSDAAFIAGLLYERRYSLLWEQGTRWIDARRFRLLATIPAAVTGGSVPVGVPVPAPACDARNLLPKTVGDMITCTP